MAFAQTGTRTDQSGDWRVRTSDSRTRIVEVRESPPR